MMGLTRKKRVDELEEQITHLTRRNIEMEAKNRTLEKNLEEMWDNNPPVVKILKDFREFYFRKFPGAPQIFPTKIFRDFIREKK